MDERPDPAKIERGLSEGQRFALAASRDGKVAADVGTGHTNAALRRRGLLPLMDDRDLVWDRGSWWLRLTELGCEVAQLAKQSTRVGGGRGKRGPRSWARIAFGGRDA